MIFLSGANVVLRDRVLSPGTVVIDGERIVDVVEGQRGGSSADQRFALPRHHVVPGFIDVHIHGVEGTDSLDGVDAVRRIARRLPRYGVTAFCPTSVACSPDRLRDMLGDVRRARVSRPDDAARVLPAHLESNFINADFKGAQPLECLRLPSSAPEGDFSGRQILDEIAAARGEVGIITVAPELDGVLDLIRDLASHGHVVSLGHSGATYDEAVQAIEAGARHATHLFNRMTPIGHRAPGLAGAVMERSEVAAEVICDGVHVHPAMVRLALAAKSPRGIMAITDGTAGAGLPKGSRASLGGRVITVEDAAYLDDGTLAGSVLTMDRAFAMLVRMAAIGLVEAATVCSTTPACTLELDGLGAIEPGAIADIAVLDEELKVRQTFVAGRLAWSDLDSRGRF
jgi:N-acetylglucosamine-6-phosphate deacetylase